MILQALNEYYQRRMADPDPARRLPAFGLESKEIPFVIELSGAGEVVAVKDTRRIEGKRSIAARFLVPKGVKKTSGVAANLLWDTAEYVLGIDTRGNADRVAQQHAAYRERILDLPDEARNDAGVRAVMAFLDREPASALQSDVRWEEIRTANPVMTFRLAGDIDLVCQRSAVVKSVIDHDDESPKREENICLVTGNRSAPQRLHSAIKGIWGAQTSGANIVSFNLDAFNSFGKKQGFNAPISAPAAFAYTTALNHLLDRGSRQRVQIGDASTVFWAARPDPVEDVFASVFGRRDDPDSTEEVRALLEAVRSGQFDGGRGRNQFHVLGLSPNAARISVRFWYAASLFEIGEAIRRWFSDIEVVRGPNDPPYPSLFRLLTASAVQGKADNVPPSLGGGIVRSILTGGPFPAMWLGAAVQRCRAEQRVTYLRAAAIKACLNRNSRRLNEEECRPMLDPQNTNVAYRLGRLFAALEKVQEEASPGINATIRERYYGAASSTPVAVFTTLLRLKNHHVAKLEFKGRATFFEKLIGEIVAGIGDFPAHLALPDQGRFALGYYHQRQAFFAKTGSSGHDQEN